MKPRFKLASFILLLSVVVACHRIKRYPMRGEVVAKSVATGEITVKHGDIPGFMMAMTMPYRVKNSGLVQEVQPGDKIAAEVVVGSDRSDYWLEDVRITDESARGQAQPATGTRMLIPALASLTSPHQPGRPHHSSFRFFREGFAGHFHLHALPDARFLSAPEQSVCADSRRAEEKSRRLQQDTSSDY